MAPQSFSSLPTELRLQIWEHALYEETEKRLVLTYGWNKIFPMKRLVSPLLSVNPECRAVAKSFYNFNPKVYRCPSQEQRKGDGEYTPAGILHLSLERDIFVKGFGWPSFWVPRGNYVNFVDYDIVRKHLVEPMTEVDLCRPQRSLAVWLPLFNDPKNCGCSSGGCYFCYRATNENWYNSTPEDTFSIEMAERKTLFHTAKEFFVLDFERMGFDDVKQELLTSRMVIEMDGEDIFALPWIRKRLLHFKGDPTDEIKRYFLGPDAAYANITFRDDAFYTDDYYESFDEVSDEDFDDDEYDEDDESDEDSKEDYEEADDDDEENGEESDDNVYDNEEDEEMSQ
ncbi:hypothetical protein GGR53DRAFT_530069 [Hypoxylon sp. FL1150]|nr:hypothetical protein GGR53DRAFT_530069 [Hypoxylon sp. FL1150]